MIKKKYFVWEMIKENNNFYSHPNTFTSKVDKWGNKITVKEYGYNNGFGAYLGLLIVDDSKTSLLSEITVVKSDDIINDKTVVDLIISKSEDTIDYNKDFEGYDYKYLEPVEVIKLLNVWYPVIKDDEKSFPNGYFSLGKDGFSIVDDKPRREEMII